MTPQDEARFLQWLTLIKSAPASFLPWRCEAPSLMSLAVLVLPGFNHSVDEEGWPVQPDWQWRRDYYGRRPFFVYQPSVNGLVTPRYQALLAWGFGIPMDDWNAIHAGTPEEITTAPGKSLGPEHAIQASSGPRWTAEVLELVFSVCRDRWFRSDPTHDPRSTTSPRPPGFRPD